MVAPTQSPTIQAAYAAAKPPRPPFLRPFLKLVSIE
jgi:hypothetical protein